jgi:hypothetical protein
MATLAVRTIRLRDLARLRTVNQRVDRLDSPVGRFEAAPQLASVLLPAIPFRLQDELAFVATIDGELCAYLVAKSDPDHYQWTLSYVAAGSPRLDATDSVCVELWSALIEYSVKQAGASGSKRIFALARRDTPAYESLRSVGFEPYEDRFMLAGSIPDGELFDSLAGVKRQSNSDVWSVHQLYHTVTPRAVQFAEALTSEKWEVKADPWLTLPLVRGTQEASFVLEFGEGVVGHCRIVRRPGRAMVNYMIAPEYADQIAEFIVTSLREAGAGTDDQVQVCVPGYAMDHISRLEEAGFRVFWERAGLVKHTTASVVVRPRLVPVSGVEERERAVRGVPSLYQ